MRYLPLTDRDRGEMLAAIGQRQVAHHGCSATKRL